MVFQKVARGWVVLAGFCAPILSSSTPAFGEELVFEDGVDSKSGVRYTAHTRQLDPAGPPPTAALADVAFLEGRWLGVALGGEAEEVWSAAAGGAMMGMFRLVADGVPSFYELFVLQESEGGLVLRLKHFDGQTFHGWEEKDGSVDFSLVAVEDQTLYLAGLTYRRTSEDELDVYVAMRGRDEKISEIHFPYRRVD